MKEKKKISTKKKIVDAAIRMYNEKGIQNVTSRHIAADMGIAYGNLDYHYRTKEDLLLAIHKKMRKEMTESFTEREESKSSFEHFNKLLDHIERFQHKYKCFNLDVLEISRSYPQVNESLSNALELRVQQMSDLFEEFVNDGFLMHRTDEGYKRLEHKIRILITFWLSQQVVLSKYEETEIGEMRSYIWELLVPYMTKKGLEEYRKFMSLPIYAT